MSAATPMARAARPAPRSKGTAMTRPFVVAPALVLALLIGCSREASTTPAPPPAETPPPETATTKTVSAADALDALDKRTPVPLLPMMAHHQKQNMRDHLVAVQEIVAALATDNYAAIEKAAGRIGYSDHEAAMCNHMGAGAPTFTEQALAFHRTADRITQAARDRDRTRVLTELGITLKTCTACHETWKQQVVDQITWQRVTSAAPPAHGAAH